MNQSTSTSTTQKTNKATPKMDAKNIKLYVESQTKKGLLKDDYSRAVLYHTSLRMSGLTSDGIQALRENMPTLKLKEFNDNEHYKHYILYEEYKDKYMNGILSDKDILKLTRNDVNFLFKLALCLSLRSKKLASSKMIEILGDKLNKSFRHDNTFYDIETLKVREWSMIDFIGAYTELKCSYWSVIFAYKKWYALSQFAESYITSPFNELSTLRDRLRHEWSSFCAGDQNYTDTLFYAIRLRDLVEKKNRKEEEDLNGDAPFLGPAFDDLSSSSEEDECDEPTFD